MIALRAGQCPTLKQHSCRELGGSFSHTTKFSSYIYIWTARSQQITGDELERRTTTRLKLSSMRTRRYHSGALTRLRCRDTRLRATKWGGQPRVSKKKNQTVNVSPSLTTRCCPATHAFNPQCVLRPPGFHDRMTASYSCSMRHCVRSVRGFLCPYDAFLDGTT